MRHPGPVTDNSSSQHENSTLLQQVKSPATLAATLGNAILAELPNQVTAPLTQISDHLYSAIRWKISKQELKAFRRKRLLGPVK